jgi:succinate dehydrogenase / fumarate reductase iron-sulfur subunit
MRFTLNIWRQQGASDAGRFVTYDAPDISSEMSFLEMLDVVNERLIAKGEEPFAFDHDCREGICGTCGCMVNGYAHGHQGGTTLCQLHMRAFKDGETIWVEPWRARAFPVVKDLVVDRGALDQIIQSGGHISVRTGSAPEAHSVLVPKEAADLAFSAAACIGCGACVAACPNASAMLFTSAKLTQLALLPQGQPERWTRAKAMVSAMEQAGFGPCSNHGECEAACPKEIPMDFIAQLNRDLMRASLKGS